jgi:hypothetical protein
MSARRQHALDAARLLAWRTHRLTAAGFSDREARKLARTPGVDLHRLLELIDLGCPPDLAARITAPLDSAR